MSTLTFHIMVSAVSFQLLAPQYQTDTSRNSRPSISPMGRCRWSQRSSRLARLLYPYLDPFRTLASTISRTVRGKLPIPSWSLFADAAEQLLYGIVQDIASQFPAATKARYQAAAKTFRIPYWDWAATPDAGDYFPNAVGGSPAVNVITPKSNGQAVSIANPLYSTTFRPLNPVPGDFAPLGRTPVRHFPSSSAFLTDFS